MTTLPSRLEDAAAYIYGMHCGRDDVRSAEHLVWYHLGAEEKESYRHRARIIALIIAPVNSIPEVIWEMTDYEADNLVSESFGSRPGLPPSKEMVDAIRTRINLNCSGCGVSINPHDAAYDGKCGICRRK